MHVFFADGGLVAEIQAPNCEKVFFGSPSNVNRADRQVELVALAARPMDWRMGGLVSPNAREQRPRPPPIEVATSEKQVQRPVFTRVSFLYDLLFCALMAL